MIYIETDIALFEQKSNKKLERVIRHEHSHRFENSIQEKPIDLNINN